MSDVFMSYKAEDRRRVRLLVQALSDQAISLDPLNVSSYFTRFFALVTSRRFGKAVRYSQGIERTKPHLFDWPDAVAYVLIVQNKLAGAESYQQKAATDNYNRLVNEAVILFRTGLPVGP